MHAKFTKGRHHLISGLIRNATERGDLPPDTDADQMADDLAAGVFFRGLVRHEPIDTAWVETHVDRWISFYSNADLG